MRAGFIVLSGENVEEASNLSRQGRQKIPRNRGNMGGGLGLGGNTEKANFPHVKFEPWSK
jgi:hypothetical protein